MRKARNHTVEILIYKAVASVFFVTSVPKNYRSWCLLTMLSSHYKCLYHNGLITNPTERMLFGMPVVSVDFLVPADMLVCVGEVA